MSQKWSQKCRKRSGESRILLRIFRIDLQLMLQSQKDCLAIWFGNSVFNYKVIQGLLRKFGILSQILPIFLLLFWFLLQLFQRNKMSASLHNYLCISKNTTKRQLKWGINALKPDICVLFGIMLLLLLVFSENSISMQYKHYKQTDQSTAKNH